MNQETSVGSVGLAVEPGHGYEGNIAPELAYEWMVQNKGVLLDIRTRAERDWVGFVPGSLGIEWKIWPSMAMNPNFDEQLQALVPMGAVVLCLCRSGARSVSAAQRAQSLGYRAFNILEGFEGDLDEFGRRGFISGWRFRGLPWRQG